MVVLWISSGRILALKAVPRVAKTHPAVLNPGPQRCVTPPPKGALATSRMWVIMRAGHCDGGPAVESSETKCQHLKRCPLAPVGSTVVFWMAAEDRESMEARGAGESCPTFPKVVPGDPMSEGKSRPSLVRGGAGVPHVTAPACPYMGRTVLWEHVNRS